MFKDFQFIEDVEPYEPVYLPQENILEECLRRDSERTAHQENLMNRVVYDCIDASPYNSPENQFENEENYEFPPYYVPTGEDDYTLVFESRFESGNLRRAIQVYEFEYDLILKPDYNTKGNTQWFYFQILNVRAGKTYRFNIINMMKPDSLYNQGMKPLAYSTIEAQKQRRGWHRKGQDIYYYQNSIKRRSGGYYFTLTFSMTFNYDFDNVYLSHCYPYTYSDLINYLRKLEEDPRRKNRIRRKVLCQTIAGNNCEVLTITNFQSDAEVIKNRRGIFLSSRVHPGETNSS